MGYKSVVLFLAIAALYACADGDVGGPQDWVQFPPQVFLSNELHASRFGEPAQISGPAILMEGDTLVSTISVYHLGPGSIEIQGVSFILTRQDEDGLPLLTGMGDDRFSSREIFAGDSLVLTTNIVLTDEHGPHGSKWRAGVLVDGVQFCNPSPRPFTE